MSKIFFISAFILGLVQALQIVLQLEAVLDTHGLEIYITRKHYMYIDFHKGRFKSHRKGWGIGYRLSYNRVLGLLISGNESVW